MSELHDIIKIIVFDCISSSSTSKGTYKLLIPNRLFTIPFLLAFLFSVYCSLSITQSIYIFLPVYLLSILENHSHLTRKAREYATLLFAKDFTKLRIVDSFMKPFVGFVGFSEWDFKRTFQWSIYFQPSQYASSFWHSWIEHFSPPFSFFWRSFLSFIPIL